MCAALGGCCCALAAVALLAVGISVDTAEDRDASSYFVYMVIYNTGVVGFFLMCSLYYLIVAWSPGMIHGELAMHMRVASSLLVLSFLLLLASMAMFAHLVGCMAWTSPRLVFPYYAPYIFPVLPAMLCRTMLFGCYSAHQWIRWTFGLLSLGMAWWALSTTFDRVVLADAWDYAPLANATATNFSACWRECNSLACEQLFRQRDHSQQPPTFRVEWLLPQSWLTAVAWVVYLVFFVFSLCIVAVAAWCSTKRNARPDTFDDTADLLTPTI